jgi:hypothetical protein
VDFSLGVYEVGESVHGQDVTTRGIAWLSVLVRCESILRFQFPFLNSNRVGAKKLYTEVNHEKWFTLRHKDTGLDTGFHICVEWFER